MFDDGSGGCRTRSGTLTAAEYGRGMYHGEEEAVVLITVTFTTILSPPFEVGAGPEWRARGGGIGSGRRARGWGWGWTKG